MLQNKMSFNRCGSGCIITTVWKPAVASTIFLMTLYTVTAVNRKNSVI